MINQQTLEGSWNELKGKIQHKWGELSDSDVAQFRGSVDELIGLIQRKTGEGRAAIEAYLEDLTGAAGTVVDRTVAGAKWMIHDRTGRIVAACFGIGLLLGLALASRHREDQ